MALIGITCLRVRSVGFAFAVHFLRARRQAKQAPGL
jgi:hypothetical protein